MKIIANGLNAVSLDPGRYYANVEAPTEQGDISLAIPTDKLHALAEGALTFAPFHATDQAGRTQINGFEFKSIAVGQGAQRLAIVIGFGTDARFPLLVSREGAAMIRDAINEALA